MMLRRARMNEEQFETEVCTVRDMTFFLLLMRLKSGKKETSDIREESEYFLFIR